MSEMNGLRALLREDVTLHSLAEPPDRGNYSDDGSYERAYDEWFVRMNYWHVERRP